MLLLLLGNCTWMPKCFFLSTFSLLDFLVNMMWPTSSYQQTPQGHTHRPLLHQAQEFPLHLSPSESGSVMMSISFSRSVRPFLLSIQIFHWWQMVAFILVIICQYLFSSFFHFISLRWTLFSKRGQVWWMPGYDFPITPILLINSRLVLFYFVFFCTFMSLGTLSARGTKWPIPWHCSD